MFLIETEVDENNDDMDEDGSGADYKLFGNYKDGMFGNSRHCSPNWLCTEEGTCKVYRGQFVEGIRRPVCQ